MFILLANSVHSDSKFRYNYEKYCNYIGVHHLNSTRPLWKNQETSPSGGVYKCSRVNSAQNQLGPNQVGPKPTRPKTKSAQTNSAQTQLGPKLIGPGLGDPSPLFFSFLISFSSSSILCITTGNLFPLKECQSKKFGNLEHCNFQTVTVM